MALTREAVQAVKDRADIVEIVGERVRLAPAGSDFVGLCPFHNEKTPSFRVSPGWKTYHCFGCGTGGSAIDFVMATDNLSFPEAVSVLAGRYGVELPGRGAGGPAPKALDALGAAEAYYHERLLKRPEGEVARRYLRERGFGEAQWEAFRLGYAPDDWQGFTNHGRGLGFAESDLMATGLVREGKSGRAYDLLRKRVVFPILSDQGKAIAFGGRVIGGGDSPKYLNTPETPFYKKKQVLFGLHQGLPALRESGAALLVEGYLDVIRLHQHGIGGALATCGTSLTEGHLQTLRRHAKKVVLLFDGDDAGIKAALRSAPLFFNQGLEARVVLLPGGMDPDDFLARQGRQAFLPLVEEASSLLEFLVFQMLQRHGRTPQGREAALETLVPVLAQVRKAHARDLAVRFLSDQVGVRHETVLAAVKGASRGKEAGGSGPAMAIAPREDRHQRRVLRLLLEEPALLGQVRELLRPAELSDPGLRQLLEKLLGFSDEEFPQLTPQKIMEWYPEHAGAIRELLMAEALHQTAISDYRRQLENEIYSIKESLKEELFRKCKALAGSREEEEAVLAYRRVRDELRGMKEGFRKTHALRPEVTLKEDGTQHGHPAPPPGSIASRGR